MKTLQNQAVHQTPKLQAAPINWTS